MILVKLVIISQDGGVKAASSASAIVQGMGCLFLQGSKWDYGPFILACWVMKQSDGCRLNSMSHDSFCHICEIDF